MDGASKVNNIQVLGSSNTNLKIAGIGDFDGDGDNDIATFNTNSGALRMWVMEGTTRVANISVLTGANLNLVPRGAGDMDGDGIPDIVLRNNNSGAVRVWTMNDDFTRKGNEYVTGSSNTNLELRGVVDINADGNNDILNYNTNTGKLRAWLMDGNLAITENAEIVQDLDLDWSVRGSIGHTIKMTILEKPSIDNVDTIKEASDLAFNQETHKLYIVGDKGDLYVYDVSFNGDAIDFKYQNEYKINHPDENFNIDSEGLAINAGEEMIVSFEGRPRISNMTVEGELGKSYTLPEKLNDSTAYAEGNAMLEALAWHGQYGILTAAEFPVNGQEKTEQTIYALDGTEWNFKAEEYENSAVTAIEVMDDGNLLVLERAYKEGIIPSFYITVKKLYLGDCNAERECKTEKLYSKLLYLKNYEGLTKVGKNRYLMVTDNQGFVATDFIYFEVK